MRDVRVESLHSAITMLSRTWRLLRLRATRAAAAFFVMTGPGIVIDSGMVAEHRALSLNLALSIVILILQYWVIRSLLDDLGWPLPERPRFPAFFLAGIVLTLGILLGLVALVVPGIVLFVRWSIATPLVIGTDRRVFDAIGESWRATGAHFWPIAGALAAIYGTGFLVALAGMPEFGIRDPLAGAALLNIGINASLVAGWYASVAICLALRGPQSISRIFE